MKKYLFIPVIVSALFLSACQPSTDSSFSNQSKALESTQKRLVDSVPVPQINTSEERKNVSKRAELFNSENKISYIYLINYGKVMAFYTVKGKVSSLRSYMTPPQQIVNSRGIPCERASYEAGQPSCGSSGGYLVDAPDIDGTFGENVSGIFFFTTEGAYVEWNGDYMMSDQPLKLSTPPELVRQIQ